MTHTPIVHAVRRCRRISLPIVLAVLAAALPSQSFSQGSGVPRRLLQEVPGGAVRRGGPAQRPTPLRSRHVRLALEALEGGSADRGDVELDLFSDTRVRVRLERLERRGAGSFTWQGRVEDGERGSATFVATNGVVAGTVFTDSGVFEIGYAGDGIHEIRQLDPMAFPTDDPPDAARLQPPADAGAPDDAPATGAATPGDPASQIDVLVVWTPAARAAAGGADGVQSLIDLAVANTNTSYANSGVGTRIRLVHKAELAYAESDIGTDLSRLTYVGDGHMDGVHDLRDQHGADLVALIGTGYSGACGIGYLMTAVSNLFAGYAFSVIDQSCAAGNLSFAHELGHNQGMHHDAAVTGGEHGAFAYSHGYVDPSCAFRTVMAYGSCPRVTRFSSAGLTYGGRPTGTSTADNARTLGATASTVANFRQAVTPACSYVLSPSALSITAVAGAASVTVSTADGCAWTAGSDAPSWIAVGSAASGVGSGVVSLSIGANAGAASRTATFTIAGQPFTVTQAGTPCSYGVSTSAVSLAQTGGTATVTVTAGSGCAWTSTSGSAWITIGGGTGTGTSTVSVSAPANTAAAPRSTSVTIAGNAVSVTQPGAALAESGLTITAPAAPVNVPAADDFAIRVLQDRWDMNERSDLGWFVGSADQPSSNLLNAAFAGGWFTATSATSDPSIFLLETGNPVAVPMGKTGSVFAIDANKYRRLNFRLCLPADSTGQLFWSRGTIYSDNSMPNAFFVHGGCQVYSLDLRAWSVGRMPAIPSLQQYDWTGVMRSLRLDPTSAAGHAISLDWASLTDVSDASTFRTVTWSGSSPVTLYLDTNATEADGTLGPLWNDNVRAVNLTGGSYTFQFGALPPGDYYVGMRRTGTTDPLVYSPGFYRVGGVPTVRVLSPSEEGSADDFATVQLGNPWDMTDSADVDVASNVTGAAFTTMNLETQAGEILAGRPVYRAASAANSGDPIVRLLWQWKRGVNYRIDTSRYRLLTLDLGVSGARNINQGSVVRVIWKRADEAVENVSQDIVLNHRAGANTYQSFVADMAALPLETDPGGSPSRSGWTGLVNDFRIDPHEFLDARQFYIHRARLAAFERTAGSYVVRWKLGGVTDTSVRVSLFADNDGSGFDGTPIATGLAYSNQPDGSGSHTWNTGAVPNGTYYIHVRVTTAGGALLNQAYARWPLIVDHTYTPLPVISLSRQSLRFAATKNGAIKTGPQEVGVTFAAGVTSWSAASITPGCDFVKVNPASGSGTGAFLVSMQDRTNYPTGARLSCTVRVTAPGAANSPQFIAVNFDVLASTVPPVGVIDTPANNATNITGAIPVSGWALDDIQVTRVSIWRNPAPGEYTPHGNGLVYIGDAAFLEDARPDVAAVFPQAPLNYRGGWGYLMLTRGLPNGGNGTFDISVYAQDAEGKQTRLGVRRITVTNATAVKPFGSIDTPGQGETVSGVIYNWGWALTPNPANYIPNDGSTITVYIDGVAVGNPVYGLYRPDIATAFPGFANSDSAVGYFLIDTRTLSNGVHTLGWLVTDSAGNTEGIGSRFFRVRN